MSRKRSRGSLCLVTLSTGLALSKTAPMRVPVRARSPGRPEPHWIDWLRLDRLAPMDTNTSTEPRLSPSEALTLRNVAKGELLVQEMDWVAVQRLKGWGLLEERGTGLKLTQAGRDALRLLMARS
jgi:hypothetical protein